MVEQNTHPVYIDKSRKQGLKQTAAEVDESMKTVTERYVNHGEQFGLHDVPVRDDPTLRIAAELIEQGVAVEDDGRFYLDITADELPDVTAD